MSDLFEFFGGYFVGLVVFVPVAFILSLIVATYKN